jgi:FkbM family methyltransferase
MSESVVLVRPWTTDLVVLEEIFVRRLYEPRGRFEPPARAVDLGANIGLFSVFLRGLYPQVAITAFEPDPANVALLRRNVDCELVQACAGVADGLVPFVGGLQDQSRIAAGATEEGATLVPVVDVFPYLEGADLVKIDIQGGEWELLADPRLAASGVRGIFVEYHAYMCPEPAAPRQTAERLLAQAGYAHELVFDDPDGFGMLWAWR